MKLYIYEHCPFCVRARMIFGLKKLNVEKITLLNDDEETPVRLIGKKAVPILIKNDGTSMPESLDIVRYIDDNFGEKLLLEKVRPELEKWINHVQSYYNHLLTPRFIQLGLAEYATQSAVEYFIKKKTQNIGDFAENLAKTAEYLAKIHEDLTALSTLILSDDKANGTQLSMEDIMLFPMLRNLTCVKGLIFPETVAAYVHKMAELSQIDLYFERAV